MKLTPTDQAILAALELFDCAGDVAAETGADFRRVIHLQRLYGPTHCQEQRAREDAEARPEATERTQRGYNPTGPCSQEYKESTVYGDYWRKYREELPPPKPRPQTRFSAFELYLESMAQALGGGGRRAG